MQNACLRNTIYSLELNMKIIKKLSKEEVKKVLPQGLQDALSGKGEVYYCNNCDGLRIKGHACVCCIDGKTNCEHII